MHELGLARQADVRDQRLQRPPLQSRYGFWLGGNDGGLQLAAGALAHLLAQRPQVLDVLRVHGELVVRRVVCRALRVGPSLESARAGVYYVIDVRAAEVGGEGDIEGEIDVVARRGAW